MRLRILSASVLLLACVAPPVAADVTHHFSGRFGVGYSTDPNAPGSGRAQPMYEGSYTTRFSHETDSGVRFRFDIGIVVSNFESHRPLDWPPGNERR